MLEIFCLVNPQLRFIFVYFGAILTFVLEIDSAVCVELNQDLLYVCTCPNERVMVLQEKM